MSSVHPRQHTVATRWLAVLGVSLASLCASPALAGQASGSSTPDKEPTITVVTKPSPVVTGVNDFTVTVLDAAGKPISGADVTVTFVMAAMPAMKMPEMRNSFALKPVSDRPADAGKYAGRGQVMMAGPWTMTVTAKVRDKTVAETKMNLTAR